MPRGFATSVLYPCAFAQAALAIWFKYPNPYAEHVRSIDILDEYMCPETGVVHMERLISVEQSAPRWIRSLLGADDITYVRELIRFDPRMPAVDMESANLSFSDYLLVQEKIRYTPFEKGTTRFDQKAEFHCRGLEGSSGQGLFSSAAHAVEEASVKRFRQNAAKGRAGFSYVLMALFGDKDAVEYEAHVLDT